MEKFNLSRTQWKVFSRFNFLPSPCSQQQLLNSMGIDRAYLTRTLDQLGERGLIAREKLLNDKRAYNIFPIKAGIKLVKEIEKFLLFDSKILVKDFSPTEIIKFNRLIDNIEANIQIELESIINGRKKQ